jgi:hypothetical protein
MIGEVYTEITVLDLIQTRFLSQGTSPDPDQTEALLGQIAALNLGALGSEISFQPESDTPSSAKKFNKALTTFTREIKTILESAKRLQTRNKQLFDRGENKMTLIAKQATDLGIQGCALQLGRQDGLNLYNWDSLNTLQFVDQQLSSVEFDNKTRGARLRRRPNEKRVDLTGLQDSDFDSFVSDGETLSQGIASGSRFFYAVDDSDGYWMHRVTSKTPGSKTLILQLDMKKEVVISKLVMTPFNSNTNTGLEVRVLGSLNRVNWRELQRKIEINAPRVQIDTSLFKARYLRIEMTHNRPSYRQVRNFVYEFGLNDLAVFETFYYLTARFVSKPIEFQNINGIAQRINRLRMDFQDVRPLGTDIVYYVTRADDLNNATRIKTGEEITFDTVLEDNQDQGKIRSRYDNNHALVNIRLEEGFIPESVRFFRNTYQEDVVVNDVAAGWLLSNSYYSCVFELNEELEINLGINFAFIDGKKVNGIQIIPAGFHTFRTHETNWRPATTQAADVLYPHNHKLLIEGLTDSDAYQGADFIAAKELRMISTFDLLSLGAEFDNFFSIRDRYPMIKIPRPPVFLDKVEGWRLEQHALRYKYTSTDTEAITSVRLVARLFTRNPRITPQFRGYVALAGY